MNSLPMLGQAGETAAMSDESLAAAILSGDIPAIAAANRPTIYPILNRSKNGNRLPFLGQSQKIDKGTKVGVLTQVLYMQSSTVSGKDACPFASAGCRAACLVEDTGKMSFPNAKRARRRRHASFYADRAQFLTDIAAEIAKLERKAAKLGKVPAIRLNGTTDILWERMPVTFKGTKYPNLMAAFPIVRFYDYTKVPARHRVPRLPSNYHLTFSLSERADAERNAAEYLKQGMSVAVVLKAARHNLPETFKIGRKRYAVTDGDLTDVRFFDSPSVVVGLSAKGRAKKDSTGFVRIPN